MALTKITRSLLNTGVSDSSDATAITIDSSERVGIGQASPTSLLHLTSGNRDLNFTLADSPASGDAGVQITAGASDFLGIFAGSSNGELLLGSNGAEKMRIDASGNVSIQTTAVSAGGINLNTGLNYSITEGANSSFTNLFRQASSAATVLANGYRHSSNNNAFASSYASSWAKSALSLNYGTMRFYTDAAATTAVGTDVTPTERMRIDSSGKVGIGTTSPVRTLQVHTAGSNSSYISINNGNTGATVNDGVVIGAASDSTAYFWNYENAAMAFATNNTERMRVDSSGNLLLGTTTFNNLSTESGVLASNNVVMARGGLADHQDACAVLQYASDATWLRAYGDTAGSGYMIFRVGGGAGSTDTEAMRINSSGNVLINTTSDLDSSSHLQVLGSTGGGRSPVVFQNSVDAGPALSCWKTPTTTDSSARFIQFYANSDNTPMGGIVGNGASNVQFATLSDEREKENITPVDNVIEKLMNLNVVSFDWKKHDEHVEAGFIAQNVEKHFPEYVIENISQEGEEARKGTTGGMSAGYIAVLTKAIQEQQKEIEELKQNSHPPKTIKEMEGYEDLINRIKELENK